MSFPANTIFLAEGDHDFVSKLMDCIHHPEMARQIGQNARRLSERYDWSHLATEIIKVFQEIGKAWHIL